MKLNVGGGGKWKKPGWTCIDKQPGADIQVEFEEGQVAIPVAQGSVEKIYCSHFIEHFTRPTAHCFLREFHQTLQPGGFLRIVVPCADRIAEEHRDGAWGSFDHQDRYEPINDRAMWLLGWGPSKFFKDGEHKSVWTPGILYLALIKAGFFAHTIRNYIFQDGDEEMCEFDNPDTAMISVYMEAYKR